MTRMALEAAVFGALTHLGESAVRAGVLAVVAAVALGLLRVRRTSIRLFVWTVVLCGGLAMPVLDVVLPALPLHVPLGAAAPRPAIVNVPHPTVVPAPIRSSRAAEATPAAGGLSISTSENRDTGGVDRTTYAEALVRFFGALGRDRRRSAWWAFTMSGGPVAMAQGSGPERRVALPWLQQPNKYWACEPRASSPVMSVSLTSHESLVVAPQVQQARRPIRSRGNSAPWRSL